MNNNEIKERVESYREELLNRLGKLVSINSEEGKAKEGMPFGEGPAKALNTALDMLKEDGFEVKNLDNYAGYAQMGTGKKLIGVIGHLDVVPADKNDGWNTEPYEMVEKDGNVYGRGVADDKGAVVASMIAFKVLKDMNVPMNKRVRLIMGTNEETGSKCLEHYVKVEGHVDYGFTPDGDFPEIYGEKGIIHGHYTCQNTNLIAIEGGAAKNIVPGKVTAKVKSNTYNMDTLKNVIEENGCGLVVTSENGVDTLVVTGKPAHASLPELGINAISFLFEGLKEAGFVDPVTDFYCNHFGTGTDGDKLGIKLEDKYGKLTLNCGVISMKDGVVEGTIDIRFPVTMHVEDVCKLIDKNSKDENGEIAIDVKSEPLFVDPESPLAKSLYNAYKDVTNDTVNKPMTIGGGTYAKEINNTIAFGCAFPGTDYKIHDANEWVPVNELLLQAEIYVHGILNLLAIED